jgi:hypothetical protein
VGGFSGGFTVGNWAYLVPSRTYAGPVGGINTRMKAGIVCMHIPIYTLITISCLY